MWAPSMEDRLLRFSVFSLFGTNVEDPSNEDLLGIRPGWGCYQKFRNEQQKKTAKNRNYSSIFAVTNNSWTHWIGDPKTAHFYEEPGSGMKVLGGSAAPLHLGYVL